MRASSVSGPGLPAPCRGGRLGSGLVDAQRAARVPGLGRASPWRRRDPVGLGPRVVDVHGVEPERIGIAARRERRHVRMPRVGQGRRVVPLHPLRHRRGARRPTGAPRLAHVLVVAGQRDRGEDPDPRHHHHQLHEAEAPGPASHPTCGMSSDGQSPLISRHEARSQRGASVWVPRTSEPPEPPTTNRPRSRFGRVGMPPPTLTEPTGLAGSPTTSLVLPSPSRLKYEPPALVPVKASSALMNPLTPDSQESPLGTHLAVMRKVDTSSASCTILSPTAGKSMNHPFEPSGSAARCWKPRTGKPFTSPVTSIVRWVRLASAPLRAIAVPSSTKPYMLWTSVLPMSSSSM